jgi:hypothetical protein
MSSKTDRVFADELKRLVPTCAVCKSSLSGHRYAELAVACENPQIQDLLKSAKLHDLDRLVLIQNWNPVKDAVTVTAIVGPHSESMLVIRVNPFELYATDSLHGVEILSASKTAAAKTNPKLEWKLL